MLAVINSLSGKYLESWPSGWRRLPAKEVYGFSISRVRIPHSPPLTTNKLSYARESIDSKAQHLQDFSLFAIDFLSIKTPRFSLIFLLYMPLSWKTPYLEKRSTELLVMGNQGFGNWPVRTSLCLSLSTSELTQHIIICTNGESGFIAIFRVPA